MDISKILKTAWEWIVNELDSVKELFSQPLTVKYLNTNLKTIILFVSILMIVSGTILLLYKPFKSLKTKMKEYKKAAYFALKIEKRIRYLNGISAPNEKSSIDLVSSLKSSILLLDRLIELIKHRNNLHSANKIENPKPKQLEDAYLEEQEDVKISSEILTTPEEPKLSETAKELIKLRDSVLLTNTGDKVASSEIFEVLYQHLGKILKQEGVDTLDKPGKFDIEQQEVVSTRETDDPELDQVVSETIRPGYLFAGNLFRSQEVIIYRFKESH